MSAPSLQVLRAAGSPHLHLVHPGGGRTTVYRPLAAQLPADWTVTVSDDIGSGASVEALAAVYLQELLPAAGIPDAVGGWSLGGLIAFQMARLLAAAGRRPPALVLLDTPPPGSSGAMPGIARLNLEFAGTLWASLGLAQEYLPQTLDLEPETAMLVVAEAMRTAGEPIEIELLLEQFNAYARHRLALSTYAPAAGLATRALLVISSTDVTSRSWRRLLDGEPQVATLRGGHYDLLAPASLPHLARLIVALMRS